MTTLATFLFASSLLACGMAPILISPGPTLSVQANDQQASSPQPTTQDQQPSPSKPRLPRPNPDASGKYHVGDGVTAPRLTHSVEPKWSTKVQKNNRSGSCMLSFTVDTNGNAKDVQIVSSTPDPKDPGLSDIALDIQDHCIKTAQQYRFKPALFQDKPVPVELRVKIDFQSN
jgi:TonB family protein